MQLEDKVSLLARDHPPLERQRRLWPSALGDVGLLNVKLEDPVLSPLPHHNNASAAAKNTAWTFTATTPAPALRTQVQPRRMIGC